MKKFYTLLFFLIGIACNAQQDKLQFEYDSAGNQIVRQLCLGCLNKTSPIKPEDLKPEDLKKFNPEDVFSYYPNPVDEELYLKWELINNNKVSALQLYSLNGQLLYTASKLENKGDHIIPFPNYPQGVYSLVVLYTNGDQKSIKIIKK